MHLIRVRLQTRLNMLQCLLVRQPTLTGVFLVSLVLCSHTVSVNLRVLLNRTTYLTGLVVVKSRYRVKVEEEPNLDGMDSSGVWFVVFSWRELLLVNLDQVYYSTSLEQTSHLYSPMRVLVTYTKLVVVKRELPQITLVLVILLHYNLTSRLTLYLTGEVKVLYLSQVQSLTLREHMVSNHLVSFLYLLEMHTTRELHGITTIVLSFHLVIQTSVRYQELLLSRRSLQTRSSQVHLQDLLSESTLVSLR